MPTASDNQLKRMTRGISAALICDELRILDPTTELPLLMRIASAAGLHCDAASAAVGGNDLPAYYRHESALRDLLAEHCIHRARALTETDAPSDAEIEGAGNGVAL